MCLHRQEKFRVNRNIGYVVVSSSSNGFCRSWYFNLERYKIGEWYDSTYKEAIRDDEGYKYVPGFHIFPTMRDLINWFWTPKCVARVQFSDVITTGYQANSKVIVAKRRKILSVGLVELTGKVLHFAVGENRS